jgi:hypothetical protein
MRTIYRVGRTGAQELGHYPKWRKTDLRCATGLNLVEKKARSRTYRLVCPAVIGPRYRNLNSRPFAVGPCKIRRLDRRINFAFPYCYFGLFSCKKSFA